MLVDLFAASECSRKPSSESFLFYKVYLIGIISAVSEEEVTANRWVSTCSVTQQVSLIRADVSDVLRDRGIMMAGPSRGCLLLLSVDSNEYNAAVERKQQIQQ